MVDKITVIPESIRAYGNVLLEDRDITEYMGYKSALFENVAIINGETFRVFHEVYSEYTVGFNFNPGTKELYVNTDDDTIITNFSFDNMNKELQFASSLFNFGYDDDLKELYISDVPVVAYSLSFVEDSYTAVGGVATVSAILLGDGEPVSGATVTFTSDASTTTTATTDEDGVATATITFTASTTLTASYESATATTTITVQSYLFYDDCSSSSRISEYGTYVSLFGTSGDGTLSYDSTKNAYSIAKTTNRDAFTGFKIPITAIDNIKITCKCKLTSTSAYNQFGIAIQESSSKYEFIRVRGDKILDAFKNHPNSSLGSNSNVASFNSAYYYLEITYNGNSRAVKFYDANMSLVKEWNISSVQTYTNPVFYLAINTYSTNVYVKEIKAEPI